MWKPLITAVWLILFLSYGRIEEQTKQIERCKTQGELSFLGSGQKWELGRMSASGNIYITICMNSNGYVKDLSGRFCLPQAKDWSVMVDDSDYTAFCYRSAEFGLLTDIDIALHGGFEDWPSQLWCKRMRTITKAYCGARGWFTD